MRVPASKLRRPRPGASVVDRTWLFARPPPGSPRPETGPLEGDPAGDAVVTLLSAPAGAGKTTVMSMWAGSLAQRGAPVAWVSLDRSDNDRLLFWGGLLTAVDSASRGAHDGRVVGGTVDAADVLDRPPTARLEILLAQATTPVWLFLDDLQEVQAPTVLADIDDLLRRPPEGLRLVLATRRDPPVALHRLRLSGSLREIRAADLAMNRGEARQILLHHGVDLPDSDLDLLVERTGGWAAGLRLAALSLAEVSDPSAVLCDLTCGGRDLAEYLAKEVLSRLSGRERRLLRLCAVPEQLTAELAVAVTGDVGVRDVLEKLYRDNVLVVHLDQPGGWYRMHALLRAHLIRELMRAEPELVTEVHRTTARWFAGQGLLVFAMTHAVQAADDLLVVELLTRHGPTLLGEGQAAELHRLIGLSSETVRADVGVRRLDDLAAADVGLPLPPPTPRPGTDEEADPMGAEALRAGPLDALLALHRAREDLTTSQAVLDSTARSGHDGDLEPLLALNRGMLLLLTGRLDETDGELVAAGGLATAPGNAHLLFRTSVYRTALASARGQFRTVWDLADLTLRRAWSARALDSMETAGTVLLAAHSARQWLDEDIARRLLELVERQLNGSAEVNTRISLHSLAAALDLEGGADPVDVARRVRACWSLATGIQLSPQLTTYLAFLEHRCAQLCGRQDWAHEALVRVERLLGPGGELNVLTATEHLTRGRADAARRRLIPVLDGRVGCLWPLSLQQAWLVEALLADRSGQRARVHEALQEALLIAGRTGALRPFLDLPGIAALLADDASRFGRLDALADRIRARALPREDAGVVPMTPRELAVLSDLPARLTLEEIATRHHVSVNTVKTHVQSIYRKLEASNRRTAIATARRRGLL